MPNPWSFGSVIRTLHLTFARLHRPKADLHFCTSLPLTHSVLCTL